MMRTSHKHLLVALFAGVMMFMGTTSAFAALGETIPHGGYSTATDACLQCHDVHEAAGDYVLGRWSTVTYVCGSCHTLYQRAPSTLNIGSSAADWTNADVDAPAWAVRWDGDNEPLVAGTYGGIPDASDLSSGGSFGATVDVQVNYDPNYSTLEAPIPGWSEYDTTQQIGGGSTMVGQGSPFEAYEIPYSESDGASGIRGHRLGTSFSLGDTVAHADGVIDSLDYIPGGSGRLTAIRTPSVADSATDVGYEYMLPTTSVSEFPVSLNGGLYCASCHSPHGQFSGFGVTGDLEFDAGQSVNNNSNMIDPTVINKLLSSRPNHSAESADFTGGTWMDNGGPEFCGKCHDKRMSSTTNLNHSHPDFACLQCHGNEAIVDGGGNANADFPHTSANPNLLTQIPDGLCITCHAPSAIPLP